MSKYIYPIKIETPNTNPFETNDIDWKIWTKRFWKCWFHVCDPMIWETSIKQMVTYYDTILIQKDGQYYLPKNTKLYHGSILYPFLNNDPNPHHITFFGLDIVIALWYILEEIYNKNDYCKNSDVKINGYIYEFELVKELPITHIIKKLIINPKDKKVPCKKNKTAVCLHPQIAFHGSSMDTRYRKVVPIFDLCNEITFRYTEYKDYLKLKHVYFVDPYILHKNASKKNFNPVDSIVKTKPYPDKISCQQYNNFMK
jgi:hypothetical protein